MQTSDEWFLKWKQSQVGYWVEVLASGHYHTQNQPHELNEFSVLRLIGNTETQHLPLLK